MRSVSKHLTVLCLYVFTVVLCGCQGDTTASLMTTTTPITFESTTLTEITTSMTSETTVTTVTEYYDLEFPMSINLEEKGANISPLIYGQFLEHINGVIYQSIWAEKLNDRKFYYPVGEEGLSPWSLSIQAMVSMESTDSYSENDLSVRIMSGGIEQVIVTDADAFTGYFYAKGSANVTVSLANQQTIISVNSPDDWTKYEYQLESTTVGTKTFALTADDNILIDSVSLMPEDNYHGMNRETLDGLKELAGTIYRWPGGNFVSGYDWKVGIGDRDKRPCRRNLAWFGIEGDLSRDKARLSSRDFYACIEPNDMGLDEFLMMCDYIGTIPYMVVNSGLGSLEDAVDQVEYCNGGIETEYGALRVENGHLDPYNIRYWSVGNEMQGDWQLGHMSIGEYVARHNAFALAMKEVDPNILITACGDNASSWSDTMLANCADNMDYLGEHLYSSSSDDIYDHIILMTNNIEWRIEQHRLLMQKYPQANHVKIAFDELAYSWDGYADLKDAIGMAIVLNIFSRNSDVVAMANYSDAVFHISKSKAPGAINISEQQVVFQPVGLVLKNYTTNFETIPVTTTIRQDKTTRLNVAAAISEDGNTLSIAVVNPSDKIIKINPNISGTILRRVEVSGDGPNAYNTLTEKHAYETITENPDSYRVNPLSVTIFVVDIGDEGLNENG